MGGTSGAGKSTLAREIGNRFGMPYLEVDSIYHGPNWTRRPTFPADQRDFVAGPTWVTEWQGQRQLLARRADTLIWLDYPTWLVMYRVVKRTIRRAVTRETLWAGNVEPPPWTVFRDHEHIVRWAWSTRHRVGTDARRLLADCSPVQVVRLRWPHQVWEWLDVNRPDATRPRREALDERA